MLDARPNTGTHQRHECTESKGMKKIARNEVDRQDDEKAKAEQREEQHQSLIKEGYRQAHPADEKQRNRGRQVRNKLAKMKIK